MGEGADFKDLILWQRAMDLAVCVYDLVRKLPKEENYSLGDQLRRAAVSIPSNIAEGKCRNSDKEFRYFLGIAKGSCAELETQLILSERVGYFTRTELEETLSFLQEVRKMIVVLQKKLY